jgi:type IV pilus assembly protein PilE
MRRQTGFTLIELMITIAIVGILATIAATSYQRQVMSSRRTDARSALLDMAGREEKLFSTTNAYGNTPASLGYGTSTTPATTAAPILVGSGYYNVTVALSTPPAAPAYVLTATPVPGGLQAGDTACTSLILNQLGQQLSTGSGTSFSCWGTSN